MQQACNSDATKYIICFRLNAIMNEGNDLRMRDLRYIVALKVAFIG